MYVEGIIYPPKFTVAPIKLEPLIVTTRPIGPAVGLR